MTVQIRYFSLILALAYAFIGWGSYAYAQDRDEGVYAATASLFEARDLLLDITDRSASVARRKAFDQAQRQAYQLLISKLTGENAAELTAQTALEDIIVLVSGIDIISEQTSNRRYRGRMTVRFDPDSFTGHLTDLNIPHVLSAGPDIRILERHYDSARVNLWSPTETQVEARVNLDLTNRIRRYIFHSPSLADRYIVPVGVPQLDHISSFAGLGADQRSDESVLLLDTRFLKSGALEVRYRLSTGLSEVPFIIGARSTPAETLHAGYLTIMDRIDTEWRSRLLVDTTLSNEVVVELRASSASDFNTAITKLRSIPLVQAIRLNSIAVPVSLVTLQYQGRLDQLTLALEYGGLSLKQANDTFQLTIQ